MSEEATLDEFIGDDEAVLSVDPQGVRLALDESYPKDWGFAELEEVCKVNSGFTWNKEQETDFSEDGAVPVIKIGNVQDGYLDLDDILYLTGVSDEDLRENKARKDWLLMIGSNGSGERVGHCGIIEEDMEFVYASFLYGLHADSDYILPRFLFYSLNRPKVQQRLTSFTAGSTSLKNLNKSTIENLSIPTPPLPEQRKIATVLHTVDRAIEKTEEIISQLSTIRQGVRQGIFRANRTDRQTEETKVGPITIEIPSEWEIRPIREFVDDFVGGATLSKDDFTESGISVLPKKAVSETGVATVENSERQFCSEETAANNETSFIDSDFLITALRDLNADAPNIGRIVGIEPDSGYPTGEKYLLAQGVHGIQTNSGISDEYLTEISHADWYRRYVKSISVGSTQIHIRNDEFLGIEIPVPPRGEQEEIATTLRYIIGLQSKERAVKNQLQRLKHGLMQDLLSGTVRTTDTNIEVPEEIAQYG